MHVGPWLVCLLGMFPDFSFQSLHLLLLSVYGPEGITGPLVAGKSS